MRVLLTLGAVGLLLFLSLLAGARLPAPRLSMPLSADTVRVGLVQGPIHTDFLLPLDPQTRADFAWLDLPEDAAWLQVGWGARGFYTQVGDYGDLRAGTVLRALIGDTAVMRFEPVGAYVPELSITMDRLEYQRLRAVVLSDTLWDQPVGQGLLAPADRYFAAKGRFNILHPCNQWIAGALRRANRSFAIWTPTNWSIRQALRQFELTPREMRQYPGAKATDA
ncbi:DUF2459 domain-containing protein [Paracoccus sp. S1E-3]|uniref:DUF2459 domain-containing protein n=1 Tax=Paracoccus sp. S1E-3 TaxID=2756130 RepID=UPI0015EF562C|nr:DUF2459 domain-containing protein [Paracoccus sp. S1E-3]MBA4490523.1 DUF2459 domain-containing protein [Paracoccus sp. S1E-3]